MERLTDALIAGIPGAEELPPLQQMQRAKHQIVTRTQALRYEFNRAQDKAKERVRKVHSGLYAALCREQLQAIGMPEYVLQLKDEPLERIHCTLMLNTCLLDDMPDEAEVAPEVQAQINAINAAVIEPRELIEARDEHAQVEREYEAAAGQPLTMQYSRAGRQEQQPRFLMPAIDQPVPR